MDWIQYLALVESMVSGFGATSKRTEVLKHSIFQARLMLKHFASFSPRMARVFCPDGLMVAFVVSLLKLEN